MQTAHGCTDHRRQTGSQGRSHHPHSQGKHEQIVQEHVGNAACEDCCHSQGRITVIAYKGTDDKIQHEKRGKQHKGPGIGPSYCHDPCIASHDLHYLIRCKPAGQHKEGAQYKGPHNCPEEIAVCIFISLGTEDAETDGRSHPQHSPNRINKAVDREHQIQRRDPVCACCSRYKKGICQNIKRRPHSSQDIQGNIAGKLFSHRLFVHILFYLTIKISLSKPGIYSILLFKK